VTTRGGRKEWQVVENDDQERALALAVVQQDLEEEPEIFNRDFIERHIDKDKLRSELHSDALDMRIEELSEMSPDDFWREWENEGFEFPEYTMTDDERPRRRRRTSERPLGSRNNPQEETLMPAPKSRIRPPIVKIINELKSWLPNYDHGPDSYPTTLFRILASLPGGEELEDAGYEPMGGIGWHEADQLGRVLEAIQDKRDVEDLVRELMSDNPEDVEEVEESRRIRWNQAQRGNAHVSDGAEGFWADFPPGTSAQKVLDTYMATADYSGATGPFVVRAEIDGDVASVRVGPGGVVGESRHSRTRSAHSRHLATQHGRSPSYVSGEEAGIVDGREWRRENPDGQVNVNDPGLRESALQAWRSIGTQHDRDEYVDGYIHGFALAADQAQRGTPHSRRARMGPTRRRR
jgi:hypothetical protein